MELYIQSNIFLCNQRHPFQRTELLKLPVLEFLDNILNTNSIHVHIIVRSAQVLTIFLCIKRVRLNWNFIVNDVQSATYSSHGAPCPARDLFLSLITGVKVHISLWTIREYPKRHFRYPWIRGIPSYHWKCWTTINLFSFLLGYDKQRTNSSICLTFIRLQRCTKIPIYTNQNF